MPARATKTLLAALSGYAVVIGAFPPPLPLLPPFPLHSFLHSLIRISLVSLITSMISPINQSTPQCVDFAVVGCRWVLVLKREEKKKTRHEMYYWISIHIPILHTPRPLSPLQSNHPPLRSLLPSVTADRVLFGGGGFASLSSKREREKSKEQSSPPILCPCPTPPFGAVRFLSPKSLALALSSRLAYRVVLLPYYYPGPFIISNRKCSNGAFICCAEREKRGGREGEKKKDAVG